MHKSILMLSLIFCLSTAFAESEPELNMLDSLRTSTGTAKVETKIEVYEQGQLASVSLMDVYVGGERQSLAVYKSQREAGQKVLMVDDQFWLFLPSSKRAMRITAMQKMLGEASAGDVASLSWSQDYDVSHRELIDDKIQLTLVAARKGLSYSKVTLWVDAETLYPIAAELYLKSGKLAKQASFELMEASGGWRVASMTLKDRVQTDQQTKISYMQITPMTMKSKWFTPQFLVRSTP